ncbi:MAG: hypothetical protein E3J70_01590 [Candidatus Heimdallarchaeota archaeon]|nr:MAG: hypothetical protein E3J70_01590 [Candidatus Heimdallarchaeota archaeon]
MTEKIFVYTRKIREFIQSTERWNTKEINFSFEGDYALILIPFHQLTKNTLIFLTVLIDDEFLLGKTDDGKTFVIEIPLQKKDDEKT